MADRHHWFFCFQATAELAPPLKARVHPLDRNVGARGARPIPYRFAGVSGVGFGWAMVDEAFQAVLTGPHYPE